MTVISKLKKLAILTSIILGVISCSEDEEGNPDGQLTIEQTIASNSDLSSFDTAIKKADLSDLLNGSEPYTVLAPDNQAFSDYLQVFGYPNLDAIPSDILKQLLLNHIIKGKSTANDLENLNFGNGYLNTESTTNDENLSIYFNTKAFVSFNGVAVDQEDIEVRNGVIHKMVGVIPLPTLATFAQNDPTFESLFNAAKKADSESDASLIAQLANPASTLTVFAPTNEAFGSGLAELGFDSLEDVPAVTLGSILKTHIVEEVIRAENLTNTQVPTLNTGATLSINATNRTVAGPENDTAIQIDVTNVTAINGVAHSIKGIILP